jgi:hypothetical protein
MKLAMVKNEFTAEEITAFCVAMATFRNVGTIGTSRGNDGRPYGELRL